MPSKSELASPENRPSEERPVTSANPPLRIAPEAAPVATLLHDLNHFLAAALAHVENAESADGVSRSREDLAAIQDAIFGAAAIVRTLASTLTAKKPSEAETKQADVARCFRQVARILSLPGRSSVEVQLPSRRIALALSEIELKQLLMNLATNAIEAGARTVVMSLDPSADAGYATLRVRDDGPGMPEAVRARLFEPFFTTKIAHDGLGLSGVRAAVERHAGRIDVESDEGRGTTFSIQVPLSHEVPELVLVVDPDSLSARLAARMLSRAGYQTAVAAGLEEARVEVVQRRVDVAVVDVGFGDVAAITLVEELQAAGVRVIATSSREIRWSRRAPRLKKPFSVDDLIESVRTVQA
jgi:CheY-like chemotaxis protein